MVVVVVVVVCEQFGVDVRLQCVDVMSVVDVLVVDVYLFVMLENFVVMFGLMKDFFDCCYYVVFDCVNGWLYVVMICVGSDGQNVLCQIDWIVIGWWLKNVVFGLIVCMYVQMLECIFVMKMIDSEVFVCCVELGVGFVVGFVLGVF